ncbi:MAG: NHL repeat-containing protein [Chloroflexi bacterium]|nr:NHL repeat-containing protein [Chloroflexota bacterium]
MPILLDNGWGDAEHEAVSWPFEWYLRNYPNRRYFTRTIDSSINLADYPVVLVRSTNLDPIANQLTGYNSQEYKLNWWFPEDYKQFEGDGPGITIAGHKLQLPALRLDAIVTTLSVPANRASLLKFLVYRTAPDQMGAREMYFFVSKSVPGVGPAPTAAGATNAAPLASNDQAPAVAAPSLKAAALQSQSDGSLVFGKATDGSSVLSDPKNAAYGPDGRLYVVDGKDDRVVVFNPDGSIATSWGTKGTGDGQFQEPWGVAVAPNGNVYVADTWNHRVQYFDPSGKFLGKWGQLGDAKGSATDSPNVFWGPRAIAISPQGEVYVTDTGNKRVQVFGLDGSFKRMFGGAGSNPGQFNEPVGLALDADGNVWVADAWNDRVQELDPQGKPLAQFSGPAGWTSQSVTNKPFLTVDGQGQIALTNPDAGQIVVYGTDGTQRSTVQLGAGSSAVGLTVAPDGRLVVADARGSSVVSEPAPTS